MVRRHLILEAWFFSCFMANNDVSVFVKHAACIAHISLLSFSLCLQLRGISQQPNSPVYWTFCRFSCSIIPWLVPSLCPARFQGAQQGCSEAGLAGIPEQHGVAALGAPDDLKGLFQPRKCWHSVLVHRDTLTWRRESRNFTLSWGELIAVWKPKIPHK